MGAGVRSLAEATVEALRMVGLDPDGVARIVATALDEDLGGPGGAGKPPAGPESEDPGESISIVISSAVLDEMF